MAKQKPIALALQGGGAHGAFTWGVLDKLLEDGRLKIEAITGTSAGAMNAAVLAQGFNTGGPDGAREALEQFWHAIHVMGQASPIKRSFADMLMGNWSLDASPAYNWLDVMSRLVSPYDTNPLDINPLLDLLSKTIDFERVRACTEIELFISATNVRNGKIKVFKRAELTADMLMASACLPHLYKSVEIDGDIYWDGGYMGNPPIFPLFYNTKVADIVIIQINPIERAEEPKSAREIHNRVNEISFNSSLLRELRAIDFVTRLIDDGKLDEKEYTRALLHRIEADEMLNPLSASSKMNTEWEFLCHLRDIGRNTCAAWLEANHGHIGKQSTLELRPMFQ
jgi:NTE family protein